VTCVVTWQFECAMTWHVTSRAMCVMTCHMTGETVDWMTCQVMCVMACQTLNP
jgi:hypothetical protein